MRHLTQSHRALLVAGVIVGAVVLLAATAALASTTRSSPLPDGSAARHGKQLVGTITSFLPSSVAADGDSFRLFMDLSSDVAVVPTWSAQWDGPSGLYPLSVTVESTASVSVQVPSAATTVAGSVTVTLNDMSTAWSGAYTVTTASGPHIDTISPTSVAAGSAAFTLRVNGSDFATGSNAAYVMFNGSPLAAATPTGPVNPTAILYATVPTTALFTPSLATVTVVNPNAGVGVSSNAVEFRITGPTFTDITPRTGTGTDAALNFVLSGTDLSLAAAPRTVTLKGTGTNAATTIAATSVAYAPPVVLGGQGTITGVFNLANIAAAGAAVTPAPTGVYDVVLTFSNDGVKTLTRASAFEVTGASLSGISPATATNGVTAQTLTLTGTGLSALTTPVVTLKGPGATGTTVITATGVSAVAPGTTMTATFNLTSPTVAAAGVYDVIVTYASTKTLTKAQSFTVTNALPVVTAVSPSTTWAGSVKPTTLTVSGSGFVPAPALLGSVGSKVQIGARLTSDTTIVSAGQLTVPLTAADIAAAGSVSISVVNPQPGGGTSASVPLIVSADTTTPITTVSGADTSWHKTPVTLSVTAVDAQSGIQMTQWSLDGGAPVTLSGSSISVPAPSGGAGDGAHTIRVWSTDWCNHVENPPVSVTVKIDTVGPVTYASTPSSINKGNKIAIKYRADDVSPKCEITLKIKKSGGGVARTYDLGRKSSNRSYTYNVNPNLAKGSYTVYTYARDMAGNAQSEVGKATFRVK